MTSLASQFIEGDKQHSLELALWKMRLDGCNTNMLPEGDEGGQAKCQDNCGAGISIIILNVLSFLKIE